MSESNIIDFGARLLKEAQSKTVKDVINLPEWITISWEDFMTFSDDKLLEWEREQTENAG